MAYGLEVYNSAGLRIIGIDDRCPRFYGSYTVPGIRAGGSYFLSIPGMSTDGTWFVDAFESKFNITWAIQSGGVMVKSASINPSTSFVLVAFRG